MAGRWSSQALFPILGASLLGAAASLPLHLMPFLVAAVLAQGKLPLAQAGWIASAYMVGQLVSTLLLPAIKFTRLSWWQAAIACALLLAAVVGSSLAPSAALVPCWLAVGAACGGLQFLAVTTAASAPDKPFAFAVRLSAILFVSSAAILVLRGSSGFSEYEVLALQLSVFFLALTVCGLLFYRTPPEAPRRNDAVTRRRSIAGLLVVFLFFVGQPGFWAYAVQNAQARGVVVQELVVAIVFAKIVSGFVLLAGGAQPPAAPKSGLGWPGVAAALGIAAMGTSASTWIFLAGMIVWELALNILAVRTSAAVVREDPAVVGPWLAGATFLGAAAGPALHGLAMQYDASSVFVAYSCISALFPFAWAALRLRQPAAAARV